MSSWSAQILPTFDLLFSGRKTPSSTVYDSYGYVNHPNGITVEAILAWYQGTNGEKRVFHYCDKNLNFFLSIIIHWFLTLFNLMSTWSVNQMR